MKDDEGIVRLHMRKGDKEPAGKDEAEAKGLGLGLKEKAE